MYKYYLTQRPAGPGCQPSGFVSFTNVENGELTNGKRCYGYVVYNTPLSPEQEKDYELTPHVAGKIRLREFKTLQGWHNSGIRCYEDYAQPGDYVDDATINYFRDTVPPHMIGAGYLQYGEAWDIARCEDGYNRETWTTFYKSEKHWVYAGHCFSGQDKHQG